MGCSASKNAVQEIDLQDGVLVKKSSSKVDNSRSDDRILADKIGQAKATSAKSRDSGIQEMDDVTEYNDPNQVVDISGQSPTTTTAGLPPVGKQYTVDRQKSSRSILQELEAQGLIQGGKVERGGSAFEVSLDGGRGSGQLEPIQTTIKPARLERLNSAKRRSITKEEIDRKMKEAEERRNEYERSKSRIASQLAAHVARSRQHNEDGDDVSNGENHGSAPGGSARLPPLPPRSNLPPLTSKVQHSNNSIVKGRISDDFDDDLSSLEDGMSITNDFKKTDDYDFMNN